jgi:methyl-accepting chemotaxis protein
VEKSLGTLAVVPDVVYAVARRPDGSVAGTFRDAQRAPAVAVQKDPLLSERDGVLIAAAPIVTRIGGAGTLVIGVSLAPLAKARRANLLSVGGVAAVIFFIGVFLTLVIGRLLSRPLEHMTEVALLIETGNLADAERRLQKSAVGRGSEGSSDEVGRLAASFTRMVAALRETTSTLQRAAQMLGESVENLSATAREQDQTVARQAAALQETQTTAQEIRQTAEVAGQKAAEVLRSTQRADDVTRSGETAIQQSLSGMSAILSNVREIRSRIGELNDRSQAIGKITETVKDLADQSNMLALNAAIEAVRSGEHGKGFAVVAREIRSLADQSIQATGQVRNILTDIGVATSSAVKQTETGAAEVEAGLSQLSSSSNNIRELAEIVSQNSGTVRQIVATVSQQSAGIAQIFGAVSDLNSMMSDTVRRLQTTTQAISVVKDVSQQVLDLTRRYRV